MIPRRKAHIYPGEFADINQPWQANYGDNVDVIALWEKTVALYVGMPCAAVVNSGRRGMRLTLKHLGIGPDDEVIISAYTLKDLIYLIQDMGAKVVPADIDSQTYNVPSEAIAQRITPRTKAILALHAFGSPCAIESIMTLAERHGIPVIEDCAHSLGSTVWQRQTGSFGYASFFSFETIKPVNTFGGGMVVSRDVKLIEDIHSDTAKDIFDLGPLRKKVNATRMEEMLFSTGFGCPLLYLLASPRWKGYVNGLYRKFQHAPPPNVRYSSIQAELGLKKIQSLKERINFRKEKACLLRSLLKPEIRTQFIEKGCESTWYFFVVILPVPALEVRRKLLLHGIDAGIEDEITDNCARRLGYNDCPKVNSIYSRAMALPLYERISDREIYKIARVLNKIV